MSKKSRLPEPGDKVRCSAWQYCNAENCRHWETHKIQEHSNNFHDDCRLPQYCSEISQMVIDTRVSWLDAMHHETDDKCDPNLAFKRKKSYD